MKKELNLEDVRFSIEIEVEFPNTENSEELINKHRVIPGWEMDYDGTLDNGAEYRPKKRNKLHFTTDSLTQITEIIALIKAHKGRIRPSCGFHIHIDTKYFSNKDIVSIVKRFISRQDYIVKKFNTLKNRLKSQSCKVPKEVYDKITPEMITQIKRGNNFSRYEDNYTGDLSYFTERHFALNLQALEAHGTLEFRLFNGTIQYRRIRNYVKWTIQFCINNRFHEKNKKSKKNYNK